MICGGRRTTAHRTVHIGSAAERFGMAALTGPEVTLGEVTKAKETLMMLLKQTTRYDLALIGFGGVNRALAELIAERGDELSEELGFALRVVAITDLRAGSLVLPCGIDLAPLLAAAPGELDFSGMAGGSADPRNEWVIRE
ncbi:hypothetical protein AB4Z54_54225, partial [Streptomyces sp. MCAF7]